MLSCWTTALCPLVFLLTDRADVDGGFAIGALSGLVQHLIPVFPLMFQAEVFEHTPQAARGVWGCSLGHVWGGAWLWSFGASSLHQMGGNKTPQQFVQLGYKLRFLPAQLVA